MQLKVIKADGSQEQYLHTKVIATFFNALATCAENDTSVVRQLAEIVTFYLYNNYPGNKITSCEILSIIQAVLSSTGYDDAAVNLTEHCHRRNLLRARVEITKYDIQKLSDSLKLRQAITVLPVNRWNKSKIVNDLISKYGIDNTTARIIASMVEEKVLNSGFRCVSAAFVRFLVLLQTQAILSAQQQLQPRPEVEKDITLTVNNTFTDERLRQPQNGFCPVEV